MKHLQLLSGMAIILHPILLLLKYQYIDSMGEWYRRLPPGSIWKKITYVVDKAVDDAGLGLDDIDGVAVTVGPGLIGALLVGVAAAKAYSYALNIPLIPVHHLEAHLYANFLSHTELAPPCFVWWSLAAIQV